MGLGLVLGGPSLEKEEGDPAVFSVIPRPDWVTGTKTPDVHGGFWVLSRWGSQEGGAPEPGQYLPCGLGCSLQTCQLERAAQALTPGGVTGPSLPPPCRPALLASKGQPRGFCSCPRVGALRPMSRDREMWQEGGDGGTWGHTCGAWVGRAWQEIRASSDGPAGGPGTGMQDLRLRKGDRNMGHGTRTPCTAQAHPGLRMWGQRLQMPARLQPAGQHRIGLAGAWACSGARVGGGAVASRG